MPEARGAAVVRAATPQDLHAAHAWLPGLQAAAVSPQSILVAADDRGVCGVAAMSASRAGPAMRAEVVVHPGARRQGVGTALAQGLADIARTWRALRLETWRPVSDDGSAAFLSRLGASATSRLLSFDVDLQDERLRRRLGARFDAAAAAVRPLVPADLATIAPVYATHLNESAAQAHARLLAMVTHPVFGPVCLGLQRDGVLRGFVVFQCEADGVPRLDYWFVDAHARGASALALVACALRAGHARGHARARFQCRDDARTTLRLAREAHATLSLTETAYELAL